jgi:phospholipase/carboxylesterase
MGVLAHHVLPRGPFAFEEGAAWYVGRPAPLAELAQSVERVEGVLHTLWRQGHQPEGTLLWGYSQGAMLALQIALQLPERLAGLAVVASKLHNSVTPEQLVQARGQRILLVHGREDAMIPVEQGRAALAALEAAGAHCEWIEHAGGHVLDGEPIQAVGEFARRVLPA